MSLHALTVQPVTDPRLRNPRSLARDLVRATNHLEAARADVRRLSRGRTVADARSARRASRALALVAHAEAEATRCAGVIEQAGGRVIREPGGVRVLDRGGRTVVTL